MLLSFTVSNFLSFEKPTTLSMIPSVKSNNNTINLNGVKVLKNSVIYGANASGKSNLIKALLFLKKVIKEGVPKEFKSSFCKIDNSNREKNSLFNINFFSNNRFYRFSFEINLFNLKVISEELSEIDSKSEEVINIYSYQKGDKDVNRVFNKIVENEFSRNRLATYLFDSSKDVTKLLITTLLEKEWEKNELEFISDFKEWLKTLHIYIGDGPIKGMPYLSDENDTKKVANILYELDTGISDISFIEISREQFLEEIETTAANQILERVEKRYKEITENEKRVGEWITSVRGDAYYRISKSNEEGLKIKTIRLKHKECNHDFEYGDESEGTKRLFDLLDLIFTTNKNSIYVIDEFERSLHPVLFYKLFTILKSEFKEKNIQLIFTTHETHIMDLTLFRKDEIWFIEKDIKGYSNIYSLDIFKVRNETIIKNGYIDGKYGGIPLFKKLESAQ